jgi:hypothetical protein
MLDKIDVLAVLSWSGILAALDLTGTQVVVGQVAWVGVLLIGRAVIDRLIATGAERGPDL